MIDKNFEQLFEDLLLYMEEQSDNKADYKIELQNKLKNIILYISQKEKLNTNINEIDINRIIITNNSNHDNFTYILYAIHETISIIKQRDELRKIKYYEFNENAYYSAIYLVMQKAKLLSDYENPIIGKSYNYSTKLIIDLFKNNIKNPDFLKKFNKVIKEENIFTKNIFTGNESYLSSQIPFIKVDKDFINISNYCNDLVSNLSYKEIQELYKEYPQLGLGLDSKGNIKNPEVMINEYLKNEININKKLLSFEELDKIELKKIYIYLLVPYITPKVYKKACLSNREERIIDFLEELKKIIIQKKKIYKETSIENINNLKYLNNTEEEIVKKKEYINQKIIASIVFLNNCENNINKCLSKERINKTKRR